MFANAPTPAIDELQVDRVPPGGDDDLTFNPYDDDDATEISQRSFLPYNVMPRSSLSPTGNGGTIRMEGWLNHALSSNKNGNSSSQTPTPATVPQPTSTSTSVLGKAVSKKKKRQNKKKQPRYFVLRGNTLSYYSRQHDVKAKGTFVLTTGCAVGPVMHGSLDDPASSMEVVDDQEAEIPCSLSASMTREGNYSRLASQSLADTEHASNKSKKKKPKFYCVQVMWPINNKPSKDEKEMAQAKAQVAAESEKEAMQQKQQKPSLDENATSINQHNNGDRHGPRSPRKTKDVHNVENLPSNLHHPNLSNDGPYDNENGHSKHSNGVTGQNFQSQPASLIPRPKLGPRVSSGSVRPVILNTPASTMSGMNAFHNPENNDLSDNNNNPGSTLNPETGLKKHYTQQIEKHAKDQQKATEERNKVMQLLSRKKSHKKTKKKVIQGTKVAAVSTAALTAGVLTAGIGLAAGLVFVGITAAAGGSGAMVGSKVLDKARGKYHEHQSRKSFHLTIAASTHAEAVRWKVAMETVIRELVEESRQEGSEEEWIIKSVPSGGGEEQVDLLSSGNSNLPLANSGAVPRTVGVVVPLSPRKSSMGNVSVKVGGVGSPTHQHINGSGTHNKIGYGNSNEINAYQHADPTPKWVPIQGGGMALWGILGALGGGGGNLRIYREEHSAPSYPSPSYSPSPWLFSQPATSAFPTIRRFRSDVGLAGHPFPPFKASMVLKANSLDSFMCLMCSGRIPDGDGKMPALVQPNSGQIASFRIVETMDDHMDVIHLVFRPLYLFPSWTAPRDFVLYRFWKYEDDGTYQVCLDSGQHVDCPRVEGYVRGEMHSVYTIAPLKRRKNKRGSRGAVRAGSTPTTSNTASEPPYGNLSNEECLLSHVVQIDPRGWVPTTSSLPFFRNQGYGDAFAVMALHQMLDVKEALDSTRFVAVLMDSVAHHNINQHSNNFRVGQEERRAKIPRRLFANGGGKAGCGIPPRGLVRNTSGGPTRGRGGQQQQQYVPTLDESGYVTEDEEPDAADYDFKYSGREMFSEPQRPSTQTYVRIDIDNVNGELVRHNDNIGPNKENNSSASENICTTPPPMIAEWWAEPDANSFRVRGKNYKNDRKKINAGSSLFRLLAAEIVETDVPIMGGMCLHPKERVQLALQREAEAKSKGITSSSDMPPFVFAVNIALPGPPNYHILFYYAVDDMSTIDGSDGTPSSKLCQQFFFGNKDGSFRDETFKLIPQIIEGNFMVRKAVGSTPAIMGNKIKQTYVQGERFFELMIDTGSSAVAAGVIRICNGYAKMIVVDLAFLFEGNSEDTLPERVLGCARLKNAEFGKKLRFVESVDD